MEQRTFHEVTPEIAERLKSIAGLSHVMYSDAAKMEPYSHDEAVRAPLPGCVVSPRTAQEIAEIMKLANRYSIAVTPRGAGTGLSGGAVPIEGGIVLSFERMTSILDYDRENMTITVEPGLVTNNIIEHVRGDRLFYAGYPMSFESCTIGGNVAENAGGGKAVKYGVTGRYVIGLQVVTPRGEIINLGGKRIKDVTGYNLIPLFVGSEGTLGIFTAITLRLLPLPAESADIMACFSSLAAATALIPKILREARTVPAAIEFMDHLSLDITCRYLEETLPHQDAEALLLITVEGCDRESVEKDMENIGELCLNAGALDVLIADTPAKSRKVWHVRKNAHEALEHHSPNSSSEDIVVPLSAIPGMIRRIEDLGRKYDLLIPCFGHGGDGNIHATILKKDGLTDGEWSTVLWKVHQDLFSETCALGGTISGEHGIGSIRKDFLALACDEGSIGIMKAIKDSIDPRGLLNPGKIFSSAPQNSLD